MTKEVVVSNAGAVVTTVGTHHSGNAAREIAPLEVTSHGMPSRADAAARKAPSTFTAIRAALSELPAGVRLEDADPYTGAEFSKAMRAKGFSDPQIVTVLTWYEGWAKREGEAAERMNHEDVEQRNQALRQQWGTSYQGNIDKCKAYYATLPLELRRALSTGKGSDGAFVLNTAEGIRALLELATRGQAKTHDLTIEDEIASIEKLMRTNRKAYNRDAAMQARYLELIENRAQESR